MPLPEALESLAADIASGRDMSLDEARERVRQTAAVIRRDELMEVAENAQRYRTHFASTDEVRPAGVYVELEQLVSKLVVVEELVNGLEQRIGNVLSPLAAPRELLKTLDEPVAHLVLELRGANTRVDEIAERLREIIDRAQL